MKDQRALQQWLEDIDEPGVGVISCAPFEVVKLKYIKPGFITRCMHGSYMHTISSTFHEFAAVFQFDYGTGKKWSGLDDWMTDLQWLGDAEGYLIVVYDAEQALVDEQEEFQLLVRSAQEWSEAWAKELKPHWSPPAPPALPFRFLFQVDPKEAGNFIDRINSTKVPWIPVAL